MIGFFSIISAVSAVLSVILFFKVWGMCNDVDKIMNTVTKRSGKKEITILLIEGKFDEAEEILNRTVSDRIASMYRPDYGFTEETIEKKLGYLFKEFEPYYKKMGRSIPERLRNTKGADVMKWYEYYNDGNVEANSGDNADDRQWENRE